MQKSKHKKIVAWIMVFTVIWKEWIDLKHGSEIGLIVTAVECGFCAWGWRKKIKGQSGGRGFIDTELEHMAEIYMST